jgi:hypothetical protein
MTGGALASALSAALMTLPAHAGVVIALEP